MRSNSDPKLPFVNAIAMQPGAFGVSVDLKALLLPQK